MHRHVYKPPVTILSVVPEPEDFLRNSGVLPRNTSLCTDVLPVGISYTACCRSSVSIPTILQTFELVLRLPPIRRVYLVVSILPVNTSSPQVDFRFLGNCADNSMLALSSQLSLVQVAWRYGIHRTWQTGCQRHFLIHDAPCSSDN